MSRCSDGEDSCFVAMDTEEGGQTVDMKTEEVDRPVMSVHSMRELPEEVLEYILSFLSPYQEHKTAALVCKQWYRLIKGQPLNLMFLCVVM